MVERLHRKAHARRNGWFAPANPQGLRAQTVRDANDSRLSRDSPPRRRHEPCWTWGMRRTVRQPSIFVPTLIVLEWTTIFCGFIATLVLFMLR